MTVAPSMAAASSTLSVPSNFGTRPAAASPTGGGATNRLVKKPMAMTISRPVMTRLERALAAPVLHHEQQQRHDAGDHAAGQQRQVEEQIQGDGSADHLGEIGGHRHQLGLQPVGQPTTPPHSRTDRLGQRHPGDQTELRRQVLHKAGHRVGRDDDPDQQEAELRARADVGGDVAGVDVGDGGDKRRPKQNPAWPQPRLGVLYQLTHSLSGGANRKVRLAETFAWG